MKDKHYHTDYGIFYFDKYKWTTNEFILYKIRQQANYCFLKTLIFNKLFSFSLKYVIDECSLLKCEPLKCKRY